MPYADVIGQFLVLSLLPFPLIRARIRLLLAVLTSLTYKEHFLCIGYILLKKNYRVIFIGINHFGD